MLDEFVHKVRLLPPYTQRGDQARGISELTREHVELALEHLGFIESDRGEQRFELLMPNKLPSEPMDRELPDRIRLLEILQRDYRMARAEATLLHQDVIVLFGPESSTKRDKGQVIFYAIKSREAPGKTLSECELVPVVPICASHPRRHSTCSPRRILKLRQSRR